jgi:hypothetical protein
MLSKFHIVWMAYALNPFSEKFTFFDFRAKIRYSSALFGPVDLIFFQKILVLVIKIYK